MKVNPVQKIIDQFNLVISDGAMATEIERQGIAIDHKLWSARALVDHPESIKKVHLDYFRSGADVATTNTYQASIKGFEENGWSESEAIQFIIEAVSIAREARDVFWANLTEESRCRRAHPLIAGSVGPYGAYLANGSEYRGDYSLSEEAFKTFHVGRMLALKQAGVDLFAFETMPNFAECKALARLLEKSFPSDSGWLSFSIADSGHLCDGTPIGAATAYFNRFPQICAIGVNCTSTDHIAEAIAAIKKETEKPVIVYPNSGEVYDPDSKSWHGQGHHQDYGALSRKWFECGAQLIGGCCRTSPGDIRQIAQWARS
jgi:Homocysteine/selenocysteine methylase (S-methylmethionine-dependent)